MLVHEVTVYVVQYLFATSYDRRKRPRIFALEQTITGNGKVTGKHEHVT